MPADKEIFLREYIVTRASEKELRELSLDLLDGVDDLRKNFNTKKLEEDLLSWSELAEFELYKETLNQTDISRQEVAVGHSVPPIVRKRRAFRLKPSTILLMIIMVIVLVLASLWSHGVGVVVFVAYIFALLMSITDGKKDISP